jgi:tellurite resistance protein TerC
MHSIGTLPLWSGFFIVVFLVLIIDIVFLDGRKSHRVTTREALSWTLIWITCALSFNVALWISTDNLYGRVIANQKALEFLTGYLVEESLSFDNMFVILMIFKYFFVPPEYQRRVLLYGVLGAVVMRFIMIFAGVWIINQFFWVLYLFGFFLIYTGGKMFFFDEQEQNLDQNRLLVWLRNHLRITNQFHEENFFIRQKGLLFVTPLFIALILIEVSDLVFALDSIPAIFAITRDPFIVFTSNIFAILGLRAIYFLLSNLANQFPLLKYGIALVLIFIGAKIILEHWVNIPILLALSVVATILLTTIFLSWMQQKKR